MNQIKYGYLKDIKTNQFIELFFDGGVCDVFLHTNYYEATLLKQSDAKDYIEDEFFKHYFSPLDILQSDLVFVECEIILKNTF